MGGMTIKLRLVVKSRTTLHELTPKDKRRHSWEYGGYLLASCSPIEQLLKYKIIVTWLSWLASKQWHWYLASANWANLPKREIGPGNGHRLAWNIPQLNVQRLQNIPKTKGGGGAGDVTCNSFSSFFMDHHEVYYSCTATVQQEAIQLGSHWSWW